MARKHNVNEINLQIENIDFWSPHAYNKGGMRIYWSSTIGFGTLDIVKRKGFDGDDLEHTEELILAASTEHMDTQEDKAFTSKLLSLLAERLLIED